MPPKAAPSVTLAKSAPKPAGTKLRAGASSRAPTPPRPAAAAAQPAAATPARADAAAAPDGSSPSPKPKKTSPAKPRTTSSARGPDKKQRQRKKGVKYHKSEKQRAKEQRARDIKEAQKVNAAAKKRAAKKAAAEKKKKEWAAKVEKAKGEGKKEPKRGPPRGAALPMDMKRLAVKLFDVLKTDTRTAASVLNEMKKAEVAFAHLQHKQIDTWRTAVHAHYSARIDIDVTKTEDPSYKFVIDKLRQWSDARVLYSIRASAAAMDELLRREKMRRITSMEFRSIVMGLGLRRSVNRIDTPPEVKKVMAERLCEEHRLNVQYAADLKRSASLPHTHPKCLILNADQTALAMF
mmetsp:Transcript_46708/g.144047  ORF Transcript_46708/g.144047 Transcript_46708/m.144047 type:complete len:350 (-) Transcript_46708:1207-2256(-)